MDDKDKEKITKEAQEILDWAVMHLKSNIKCKVIGYKYEKYTVQVLNRDNQLIMPVQIPVQWIKATKPTENFIHDLLETLLRNSERY